MSQPPEVGRAEALIRQPITYSFTSPDALRQYTVSMKQWLADNDKYFHGLHATAVVFNGSGTKTLALGVAKLDPV